MPVLQSEGSTRSRIRLICCACIGLLAFTTTCIAQTQVLPTDAEMVSVYCMGVLERQIAMIDEKSNVSEPIEQHRRDLVESLERLQLYMLPRVSYLDTLSLAGATARADADVDAVVQIGSKALAACDQSEPQNALTCTFEKVRSTGAWRRTNRCARIDFLPF